MTDAVRSPIIPLAEIDAAWEKDILPELEAYIRIPNKSPMFDPQWIEHGYMEQAMQLMVDWVTRQPIRGMKYEVMRLPGRTPLLFIEVEGTSDTQVLLYGHMDKQPEMVGWEPELGPWKPVRRDGKLYGRGGADDGYAIYTALTSLRLLQQHNIPHPRCVVIIEACEESGSHDLPHYLAHLGDRIGKPDLVIALDADCSNYEQLWITTSLRGVVSGVLHIEVLTEGIHSGLGSGVAPACFSVLHELLNRLENAHEHTLNIPELYVDIPPLRIEQIKKVAETLGEDFIKAFPLAEGVRPLSTDNAELKLNNTWRPTLSVVGIEGLPPIANAGNVALPKIAVKLSFRLPPTCDSTLACAAIKRVLETDPPHGAKVRCDLREASIGWNAPAESDWLQSTGNKASQMYFGKPIMFSGGGGTIPFMGMLGKQYPKAQFLITGILGPKSNAHGPNEFLHIDYAKRLTGCVCSIIADSCDMGTK